MNRLDRSAGRTDARLADSTFRDARDVVGYVETSSFLTGNHCCESWHLDWQGRFVCGTNGSAINDSLVEWANDPEDLVRTFLRFRTNGTCTPNWVIVDERGAWEEQPGEADVEQFLRLRRQLDVAGINLMDCVIFGDDDRWWSMCQLLTGSTAWGVESIDDGVPSRLRPERV